MVVEVIFAGVLVCVLIAFGTYYAATKKDSNVGLSRRLSDVAERAESAYQKASEAQSDAQGADNRSQSAKGSAANANTKANELADKVAQLQRDVETLAQRLENRAQESETSELGELLPLLLSLGGSGLGQSGPGGQPSGPYPDNGAAETPEAANQPGRTIRGFPTSQGPRSGGADAGTARGHGNPNPQAAGDGSDRGRNVPSLFETSSYEGHRGDEKRGQQIDESV